MKLPVAVAALLLTTSCSGNAQTGGMPVEVQRLGDRSLCVRLSDNPGATNVTAVASAEGLIIIDTEMARAIALELRETIAEELQQRDFRYVVNSHSHWDHTIGNQAFPEAVIIGHDLAVEEMLEFAANRVEFARQLQRGWIDYLDEEYSSLDPESEEAMLNRRRAFYSSLVVDELTDGFSVSPPSVTFSESLTLHLSDITLNLAYVGRAHSANDILIRVDEERLLVVGDLFSRDALPYIDAEADVPLFLGALDRLLEGPVDIRYVVTGHGALMDASELRIQRDYVRWVWEGVLAGREQGLGLEEVLRSLSLAAHPADLSHLSHSWGDGTDFHLLNIENAWSSLGGG